MREADPKRSMDEIASDWARKLKIEGKDKNDKGRAVMRHFANKWVQEFLSITPDGAANELLQQVEKLQEENNRLRKGDRPASSAKSPPTSARKQNVKAESDGEIAILDEEEEDQTHHLPIHQKPKDQKSSETQDAMMKLLSSMQAQMNALSQKVDQNAKANNSSGTPVMEAVCLDDYERTQSQPKLLKGVSALNQPNVSNQNYYTIYRCFRPTMILCATMPTLFPQTPL